ncbi:MAG: YgfZ/GcvT domain-containing protein [Actinomycetota bacterium]
MGTVPAPQPSPGIVVAHDDLRIVRVGGSEARRWLHDIVTSDVVSLAAGVRRPGLLLGPTGRIRAAFDLLGEEGDGVLLAQGLDQPSVADLLRPYVLSADVQLTTVEDALLVSAPDDVAPAPAWRPSLATTGAGATSLVGLDRVDSLRAAARTAGCIDRTPADLEVARILAGVARFPVDLDAESLPAEAGWEGDRIDRTKGCFVGQETVAKVANAGHPTRVVLAVVAGGPVAARDAVLVGATTVGVITSVAADPDGGWRGLRRRARTGLSARHAYYTRPREIKTSPSGRPAGGLRSRPPAG